LFVVVVFQLAGHFESKLERIWSGVEWWCNEMAGK